MKMRTIGMMTVLDEKMKRKQGAGVLRLDVLELEHVLLPDNGSNENKIGEEQGRR